MRCCARLQRESADPGDSIVMDAFSNFLLDIPPGGVPSIPKRMREIKSLLWWSWANSPDVGGITAGYQDPGTFNQVFFKASGLGMTLTHAVCLHRHINIYTYISSNMATCEPVVKLPSTAPTGRLTYLVNVAALCRSTSQKLSGCALRWASPHGIRKYESLE